MATSATRAPWDKRRIPQRPTRRAFKRAATPIAAATLATSRLEQGVDDLESLLDLERELLGAVQELAVIDGQVAANAVGIYKALGGGWQPSA